VDRHFEREEGDLGHGRKGSVNVEIFNALYKYEHMLHLKVAGARLGTP